MQTWLRCTRFEWQHCSLPKAAVPDYAGYMWAHSHLRRQRGKPQAVCPKSHPRMSFKLIPFIIIISGPHSLCMQTSRANGDCGITHFLTWMVWCMFSLSSYFCFTGNTNMSLFEVTHKPWGLGQVINCLYASRHQWCLLSVKRVFSEM